MVRDFPLLISEIIIKGFVTFDEEEDAQKALDDLGKDTRLCGKRIDIQPARGNLKFIVPLF